MGTQSERGTMGADGFWVRGEGTEGHGRACLLCDLLSLIEVGCLSPVGHDLNFFLLRLTCAS